LPSVEKLYESLKDRPDVVLLSMNVDEEPKNARAYAAKNHFQFPVLLAYTFVRKQLALTGIPRNWVFDGNFKWRTDEVGFRDNGDWVGQMTANINQARQ
jgi:hypothetical protein